MMNWLPTTLALLLLTAATTASAQSGDWKPAWDKLVADAKKEGKVVIIAPPDPQVREALPTAFKAKYGITVEYLGGRSTETAARLRTERASGIYSVDIALSGIQTMATVFHREKMLDPLKPVLMHPDVIDGSKWKSGKPWFMDPEEQYVLRLFSTLGAFFYINTDKVKPDEIKFFRDLLDPKWKGKIAAHDPTVSGTGSTDAARLYVQFGEDFVKKFYVDQKPAISRDRRQITDWLVRGNYPIAFGVEDDDLEKLRAEGFPILPIYGLSDLKGSLSAGVGQVALMSNAPHPNAAKLFINWIASKEGLEIYADTRGGAPTRTDIDALKFMPAEAIPKPGIDYFDSYDWEFTVTTKEKIRAYMNEIMKP